VSASCCACNNHAETLLRTKDCCTHSLQTCIQEMLATNLRQDALYHDWGVSWVSSVPPGKFSGSISVRPRPLPSTYFPIHRHWLINWRYATNI
jgi:hypothetical protein